MGLRWTVWALQALRFVCKSDTLKRCWSSICIKIPTNLRMAFLYMTIPLKIHWFLKKNPFLAKNCYGYTAVKMHMEFWDLLKLELTWLRLLEWHQIDKTNDVNSPWSPHTSNLKFWKNMVAWKFYSDKHQLLKRRWTNFWISWHSNVRWI